MAQGRTEHKGQADRLGARLEELNVAIGRVARSDGDDGALAAELAKLNEEYGQTQDQLADVSHTLERMVTGGPGEADVRQALQNLDVLWDELFPAEKERIVKLLVQEVAVTKDSLLIRLRLNGLNSLVAELQAGCTAELAGEGAAGGNGPARLDTEGQTLDLRVPMEFKVRGGRKEIILPPDAETEPQAQPNGPLAVALGKAFRWQKMLEEGEVGSLSALASRGGMDRSYVGRMLQLAYLAPDIVQAIVDGCEPDGLSLGQLLGNVPMKWEQQREQLGMPA